MPSTVHAALVDLFRTQPALFRVVLREAGVKLPRAGTCEITESTLPAHVSDLHADLAVSFRDQAGTQRLVVLLEVQLSVDRDKPYRWLLYQAGAQDRHRCDVVVLVVTPEAAVAKWARRPTSVGPHGHYAPLVLGPEQLAHLDEGTAVSEMPELAVLSAMARSEPDLDPTFLREVVEALTHLEDEDRAKRYFDLLCSRLGDAMARLVEDSMVSGEPMSEFLKKYYREGRAEALAQATLKVLTSRSLDVTEQQRNLLLACRDVERLERWFEQAFTVRSVEELLGTP